MTPKNNTKADSLTAVFESGNETCVKTASNVAEFFDGNGSVEFAVGLLTKKQLISLQQLFQIAQKQTHPPLPLGGEMNGTDHKKLRTDKISDFATAQQY